MITLSPHRWKQYRKAAIAALLLVGLLAAETAAAVLSSAPAFAGNGNGNGNGNGGGNGNGNGGGNGNSNGGGNGNGNGNGNGAGGGNGSSSGGSPGSSSGAAPETEIEDANSALGLREAGEIRSLGEVYKAAERQFGGEIIDAKLVGSERQGWTYDLRIVTQDGHVRRARYDAATLALRALDGQPVE